MDEPELHNSVVSSPNIVGFNTAVKYQRGNIVLIVALDRTMEDTDYEVDTITLFSCSE